MGYADLHIHSIYSWDGTCSVSAILKYASEQTDLDVIAITDHDEIDGALEAQQLAPAYGIDIVPGSEISTADGHLLALYIQNKIPAGMSLHETLCAVREQGGLCVAAHPMGRGMNSLSAEIIYRTLLDPELKAILVGIEVFNAGLVHKGSNLTAEVMMANWNAAMVGNSDSHVLHTIGQGATEFEGSSAEALRIALETGKTRVRKGKPASAVSIIGNWVPRYLLRTAGWVTSSPRPGAPLCLVRVKQNQWQPHPAQAG